MAALDYAAKLVSYHDSKVHCAKSKEIYGDVLREDSAILRRKFDELCMAQNHLNYICETSAEDSYVSPYEKV